MKDLYKKMCKFRDIPKYLLATCGVPPENEQLCEELRSTSINLHLHNLIKNVPLGLTLFLYKQKAATGVDKIDLEGLYTICVLILCDAWLYQQSVDIYFEKIKSGMTPKEAAEIFVDAALSA